MNDLMDEYHESGHAVIAILKGARVKKIAVGDSKMDEEGEFCACTEIVDIPSQETDALIRIAGPLAEHRYIAIAGNKSIRLSPSINLPSESQAINVTWFYNGLLTLGFESQAPDELIKAYEFLGSHFPPDKINEKFQLIYKQACELLNDAHIWSKIEELATTLSKQPTLVEEEITKLTADLVGVSGN